ncbi:MAG TPA: hypothetical protein VHB46_01560 [Burkholderiales bacterium]|nr:hypothetical protein [Burkholderiales bacterium]
MPAIAAIAVLAFFSIASHAAEWIDQLPDVTVVAHAVADQLKADTVGWDFKARGIELEDDDDLFAVYMTGTLVMLRQIVLYKYQEKSLSREDEAKLRSLVAAYLEAELVIGKNVGARHGYLTTAQKCRDMECYRRWFKTHSMSVAGASYRGRILARLFCDVALATELDKLAQTNAVHAPYLPSPAVTLQIESGMAGIAAAGCTAYGGDSDRNGLCDDWKDRPRAASQSIDPSMASCLPVKRPNEPVFSVGVHAQSNRWVEVRTGVNGSQGDQCDTKIMTFKDCDEIVQTIQTRIGGGCGIKDGISMRVKCPSGHVVQFISREYWKRGAPDSQAPEGNLEEGRYGTAPYTPDPDKPGVVDQTCHPKTAKLDERKWLTDSRKKSNPYYESNGSYTRSRLCMATLDAPNVRLDPQKYLAVRIVGKSFAICECNVVAVVDWERAYLADNPEVPIYTVKPPRDPLLGEVERFQAQSRDEGFDPWPSKENCSKCDQ